MTQVIAIDVGAGTADIVVRRDGEPPENSVKLVVPSQTRVVGTRIAAATARGEAVLFRGPTMGGGADTRAMKAHTAAGLPFLATVSAARSFADDLDRVRARGVTIVGDDEAAKLERRGSLDAGGGRRAVSVVISGDLDAGALLDALARLGADTRFAAAAIAVQDHGFCPGGSNRVFRFSLWERAVAEQRSLRELFYWAPADERIRVAAAGMTGAEQPRRPLAPIPDALTRMTAAAACAAPLVGAGRDSARTPTGDACAPEAPGAQSPAGVLAGDTGPAALLGALGEASPAPGGVTVLVNVGNSHTIAAVAREGRLAGVYEHHTGMLDGARLETQLRRFLAGDIDGSEVRAEGGHGAVLDNPVTIDGPLLVTGPNRALLAGTSLPVRYPAPWGDMMITGAIGLLEAFRAFSSG